MTEDPCSVDGCGRPSPTFLCATHTELARTILAEVPRMLADLDVTRTRQSRVSADQRGTRTKLDSEQLPYLSDRFGDSAAGELADRFNATLVMWATAIYSVRKDDDDTHRPPGDDAGLCAWLAGQVGFVARWTEDDAAAFIADLIDLYRRYQRMVDRRPDKKFYGACNTDLVELNVVDNVIRPTGVTCTAGLYADPDRTTVRCPACGTEHDVAQRQALMLERVLELILPASEMHAAFKHTAPDLARLLRPKTLDKWKAAGILTDVGPDLYRVREVHYHLKRIERIAARGAA